MTLEVTRKPIGDILSLLEKYEWQMPKFQRDFIWNQNQIYELLKSIFNARPIGLITLWTQPQNRPYTEPEPIKWKGVAFGGLKESPAVIKLVLDGKQRLTTLAIAFGKLRPPDARYQFSGDWFINLDADIDSDNLIIYYKQAEVQRKSLNQMSNCLAAALIPLHDYKVLNQYNQNINNPEFYPGRQIPEEKVLEARSKKLGYYYDIIKTFQIPIAELPDSVNLQQVCEIFNVLNTTGTKVSTFDLIHNLIFSDTDGDFNLRELFKKYQEELPSLQYLLDFDRPEFFCQTVTGCYISYPKDERKSRKRAADKEDVSSIKGGDLIDTPTSFYQEFSDEIVRVDTYCSQLFSDILNGEYKLKELPYPVSTVIYLALRWMRDYVIEEHERFSITDLNKLYKAFFWRNVLSQRYDQGFLTLFSSDLNKLTETLKTPYDPSDLANEYNKSLNELFTEDNPILPLEKVKELVMDGEVRGALKQALSIFLYSNTRNDIISKKHLNRATTDKNNKVELHHIFPGKWCSDNHAHHPIFEINEEIVNSIANLVPMTAESNKKWQTRSPATAIQDFELTTADHQKIFNEAFIPEEAYRLLHNPVPNPEEFWKIRATFIAEKLYKYQFVS